MLQTCLKNLLFTTGENHDGEKMDDTTTAIPMPLNLKNNHLVRYHFCIIFKLISFMYNT